MNQKIQVRRFVAASVCLLLLGSHALLAKNPPTNYAEKVNTLIGTTKGGNMYPGATYPFGMAQFTRTAFHPKLGFTIDQLSGCGCGQHGHFPTFPLNGELTVSPNDIESLNVDISNEKGIAGYYRATVQKNIQSEFAVTERTGMSQYTFAPQTNKATIIIGGGVALTKVTAAAIAITGPHTCEGFAEGGNFCRYPTPYKIYFAAEVNGKVLSSGTWKEDKLKPNTFFAEGKNSGVYFTFDTQSQKTVQYKIAISYVSVENAKENLKTENPAWDFNSVKNHAIDKWNEYLSKIKVTGTNEDRIIQFYSHLYGALIHPNICNDVNGEYMGADFKVHKTLRKQYTSYSNWDTYRTQIQLMAMMNPQAASDVVTSLADFAEQSGGGFPRWVLANIETGIMQGDPTSILISNAYAFGARDYDCQRILSIMRRGAEVPGTHSQNILTRPDLDKLLNKGYCEASMQLEYNSADFAIGRFALNACKNQSLCDTYTQRAQLWRNLINPETKWIQSRNEDGSWKSLKEDFVESTYNNYLWMIPFNYEGVIRAIGGKEVAIQRLDTLFRRIDAGYHDDWYESGNEPSFGIPWVYNWVGQPYKTQQLVNRIIKEQYFNREDGLPGNDDLGAMCAWYVFATVGLYPEIPGVGGFTVNAPMFSNVKIDLCGKELTISGGSEDNCYIQRMKLNGKSYNRTWIDWDTLSKGGTISYKLSAKPNVKWGTSILPPSFE
jgi:predicted alpha-1,2-mannosidase